MHTFETEPAFTVPDANDEDTERPFLDLAGAEGTILRATSSGLTVCPGGAAGSRLRVAPRHWGYDEIGDVHLDSDGPVGVIRATIRTSGTELPLLLLLEPHQIPAARRVLEIVGNLMTAARLQGYPA